MFSVVFIHYFLLKLVPNKEDSPATNQKLEAPTTTTTSKKQNTNPDSNQPAPIPTLSENEIKNFLKQEGLSPEQKKKSLEHLKSKNTENWTEDEVHLWFLCKDLKQYYTVQFAVSGQLLVEQLPDSISLGIFMDIPKVAAIAICRQFAPGAMKQLAEWLNKNPYEPPKPSGNFRIASYVSIGFLLCLACFELFFLVLSLTTKFVLAQRLEFCF